MPSPLYNLWTNVLKRNPEAAAGVRDAFIEAGLTPQERELIDKSFNDQTAGWGKHQKQLYGNDVDTLGEAAEVEHQRSLDRQRDTVRAYDQDVLGSYETSQQNARRSGGLFRDGNEGQDSREEYIARVRAVAYDTFERERKDELDALSRRYNIDKGQIKSDVGFLDTPLNVVGAVGRDIGNLTGQVNNGHAALVSGVFGQDSALSNGLDVISAGASGVARITGAVKDDIAQIVTESPWIKKGVKKLSAAGQKIRDLAQVNKFMSGLTGVYGGWLRQLVGDFADILDEWYHDPRTLCCFIKNMAAWAEASGQGEFDRIRDEYFSGEVEWSTFTGVREAFDKIIVVLGIIRDFLKQDVGFEFLLSIDLGLMMGKAAVGGLTAALMMLQQMLEDAIYSKLLEIVKENVDDNWRQCFPFEKMLRIIADFLSGPDGLFKYIEQYIDSFLAGFAANTNFGFNQAKKQKLLDVTAIDKLIKMLEAIRDALLNLELCIEADFSQTEGQDDDPNRSESGVGLGDRQYNGLAKRAKKEGAQDVETTPGKGGVGRVVFPTDNEVKAFVMNRLGESEAFASQVIAESKKSSTISGRAAGASDSAGQDTTGTGGIGKQIETAIGDCARTLDSGRITELANLMASWDIKL